jgi:hypothetical protein
MQLGGMSLFAVGFTIFVLRHLPPDLARPLIRKPFPPYYLPVIVVSVLAGLAALPTDRLLATLLAAICCATVIARQLVMLAANAATDRGDRRGFGILHGVSVFIQMCRSSRRHRTAAVLIPWRDWGACATVSLRCCFVIDRSPVLDRNFAA